jgi:dTDP-4-dehydrorhamnose reductase
VRILVTGGSGFIGGRLLARADPAWERTATYLHRPGPARGVAWRPLDLRDEQSVEASLRGQAGAVVIHTAYSKAEVEQVVAAGTGRLAAAAARVGARVLLISSDQVFDGTRGWYSEEAPPAPVNAYGAAKLAAERAVLDVGGCVIRTSLVFELWPPDPGNRELIVEPVARGERPQLFTDEWRCPIHVDDLVDALLEVACWPVARWERLPAGGVLHVAGPQRVDRYALGCRLAPRWGIDPARLAAASLAASGLRRPADCSLESGLARRLLRTHVRSLDEVLAA